MEAIRVILDPPYAGARNMSLDQAILESVDTLKKPTLRFYSWSPATLSLGYFQQLESRHNHRASSEIEIVRRASGGGAIVHNHELTYSVTLPSSDRWSKKNTDVYRIVHDGIIRVFETLGVKLESFDKEVHTPPETSNDFLCFKRRTDGDLICQGFKVVGSAQRRAKNALLQHGSILLAQSTYAPELPGISDLQGSPIEVDEFLTSLCDEICRRLNFMGEKGQYSSDELNLARQIEQNRFANANWTAKLRSPTSY